MTDAKQWIRLSDKKPTKYTEVEVKLIDDSTRTGIWTGEFWLAPNGNLLCTPEQASLWRYKAFKQ